MTSADLTGLTDFFARYTARFADARGCLHPMHQLKEKHCRLVAENASQIMAAESWSGARCRIGVACAWLHDVGRFPQYTEYGTFEDRKSINHAVLGAQVLRRERVLASLPAEEKQTILTAVACHNRKDLPLSLDPAMAPFVHLVRDADKLDIFRVLEEALQQGGLDRNPEVAWSLPQYGRANPVILRAVCEGHTVSYEHVQSLCDFVLVQVGWLRGQLHYDAAVALAHARGVLAYREEYVRAIDDSQAVRDCFAAVREALQARVALAGK